MGDTVEYHVSMLVHQSLSKQVAVELSLILYYKVPLGPDSECVICHSYTWEIFWDSYHMLGAFHLCEAVFA